MPGGQGQGASPGPALSSAQPWPNFAISSPVQTTQAQGQSQAQTQVGVHQYLRYCTVKNKYIFGLSSVLQLFSLFHSLPAIHSQSPAKPGFPHQRDQHSQPVSHRPRDSSGNGSQDNGHVSHTGHDAGNAVYCAFINSIPVLSSMLTQCINLLPHLILMVYHSQPAAVSHLMIYHNQPATASCVDDLLPLLWMQLPTGEAASVQAYQERKTKLDDQIKVMAHHFKSLRAIYNEVRQKTASLETRSVEVSWRTHCLSLLDAKYRGTVHSDRPHTIFSFY